MSFSTGAFTGSAVALVASAVNANAAVVDIHDQPITQIGVVVSDLDATVHSLSEVFGVSSWEFIDLGPEMFEDVTLLGENAGNYSRRCGHVYLL